MPNIRFSSRKLTEFLLHFCGPNEKLSDFYERLGISNQLWSNWSHDEGFPRLETLAKIADIVGIHYTKLLQIAEVRAGPLKESGGVGGKKK